MAFKLWSESNPKARKELKPDFGLRSWNSLSEDEKYKVWKYLEFYFFDKDIKTKYISYNRIDYYKFYGEDGEKKQKQKRIYNSIWVLNDKYKAKNYARNFLEDESLNSACRDFHEIFVNQGENVVMELLTLYCRILILEREDETIDKEKDEKKEEYQKRLQAWRWEEFDKFSENINEVFGDFGLNIYLTQQGFIPKQEQKIIEEIYKPVLSYLSNLQWKEVNNILSDAFDEHRKKTPQGYSNCVTNVFSAIQAFLQIIVNGKTGKGDISKLIPEARKKKLIPIDYFTQKIFENIESIFASERKKTSTAHPKKEYATEKNARLMLNLAMIFFQHCIQK